MLLWPVCLPARFPLFHSISCQTPEAVTIVFKCSWGWTQIASETCRVVLQLLINILPSCISLVIYIYWLMMHWKLNTKFTDWFISVQRFARSATKWKLFFVFSPLWWCLTIQVNKHKESNHGTTIKQFQKCHWYTKWDAILVQRCRSGGKILAWVRYRSKYLLPDGITT
jgi:hypothetical protein